MEQQKIVSVIVSTFQRDTMLARALNSLAAQTTQDFEIIVVDDNSLPEWSARVNSVVANFREQHPDIFLKYIQNQQNLGSAQARNQGVHAAVGEYVTFLDDDDLYLPHKIQRQLEFMRSGGFDYCVTDLDLYFEDETLSEKRIRTGIDEMSRQELLKYHLMHHITGTDTMMFRRQYLQEIGGFPPINIGDEFYLMIRAIEGPGKFGYLSGCDVRAYVHTGEGGLSSGQGKIDGENRIYEYKKGFFHQFDAKTIRAIRMRHYAVLAFAGLRRKSYGFFLRNAGLSFLCAPVQCVNLLRNRKAGKHKNVSVQQMQTTAEK